MGVDRLIVAAVIRRVDELMETTLSISGVFQLHKQQIGLTSAAQHHHAVTATIAVSGCNAAIKGDGFHGLTWQGNQLGSDLILLKPIGPPAEGVGIAIGYAHTMRMR